MGLSLKIKIITADLWYLEQLFIYDRLHLIGSLEDWDGYIKQSSCPCGFFFSFFSGEPALEWESADRVSNVLVSRLTLPYWFLCITLGRADGHASPGLSNS